MKRPNRSDVVARDQSEFLIPNLKTEEEEPEEAEMEASLPGEKKRRLEVDQVKALEKNFDLNNKLEPERKEKLAKDLGLQPRQVAVWFQNRRARWKTKQLERDYGVLKSDYDKLHLDHDSLRLQHDALLAEVEELKAEIKAKEEVQKKKTTTQESAVKVEEEETTPALLYKDASSDSDSSVILNDENSPNRFGVGDFSGLFQMPQEEEFKQGVIGMGGWDCFDGGRGSKENFYYYCNQQEELLGLEDNEFLVGEEACGGSIFSDEQMPNLDWYCSDQWS